MSENTFSCLVSATKTRIQYIRNTCQCFPHLCLCLWTPLQKALRCKFQVRKETCGWFKSSGLTIIGNPKKVWNLLVRSSLEMWRAEQRCPQISRLRTSSLPSCCPCISSGKPLHVITGGCSLTLQITMLARAEVCIGFKLCSFICHWTCIN